MSDHLRDLGMINREGWLLIGAIGVGNLFLLITGLAGSATYSLAILAILGVIWVALQQITRGLLKETLELAQESTKEWQRESDFARELVDDYVATIDDLKRYDLQSSGVHLERMRTILIKRYPDMEDQIKAVQHPLNMPGFVI